MTSLPPALRPWSKELEIFPDDLALTLQPWLARLAAAVGPLSVTTHASHGEPDGFSGLARRGPYERLLGSEWLLALEMPDEFARRAAMSEHAFLQLARREPAGSARTLVLFDSGPDQMGSPRIAHLAALIVLAARARHARAELGWAVVRSSEPAIFREVDEPSVLALIRKRTAHPAEPELLLERIEELGAARAQGDDLWVVGGKLACEMARTCSASVVEVEDVLEPDVRQVAVTVRRRGRAATAVRLELPGSPECARLLRNPFAVVRPLFTPVALRSDGPQIPHFCERHHEVCVRTVAGLWAQPLRNAGRVDVSGTSRLPEGRSISAQGESILAAGRIGRRLVAVFHNGESAIVRTYGRRQWIQDHVVLDAIDSEISPEASAHPAPISPCLSVDGRRDRLRLVFLDGRGGLHLVDLNERSAQCILRGVVSIAQVPGRVLAVADVPADQPLPGWGGLIEGARGHQSRRVIVEISATGRPSVIHSLPDDVSPAAFFLSIRPAGRGALPPCAIRVAEDVWQLLGSLPEVLEVGPGRRALGVSFAKPEGRCALVTLGADGRELRLEAENAVLMTRHTVAEVAHATVTNDGGLLAYTTPAGELIVEPIESATPVLRTLPNVTRENK